MKKISGVKVPKFKAQTIPKPSTKQSNPESSATKSTFGARIKAIQKKAKPKAGKIPVIR